MPFDENGVYFADEIHKNKTPEFLKLLELTKEDPCFEDVAGLLKEHPELFAGLNEYMDWRGNAHEQIGQTDQTPNTGHDILRNIKKLAK